MGLLRPIAKYGYKIPLVQKSYRLILCIVHKVFLLSITHFKEPIISMSSGIPWMKRNPAQKLNIVLVGESVAITPINKANGVVITFTPKPVITNDNFLLLIFGNPAAQNKAIAIAIITNGSPMNNNTSKFSPP